MMKDEWGIGNEDFGVGLVGTYRLRRALGARRWRRLSSGAVPLHGRSVHQRRLCCQPLHLPIGSAVAGQLIREKLWDRLLELERKLADFLAETTGNQGASMKSRQVMFGVM